MSLNLLVLTGKHATDVALALKNADPDIVVCRPRVVEDTDHAFRTRLRLLLVAATSGRRTILVEAAPLRLPTAPRRMLERVALGYGVRQYGRQWLYTPAPAPPTLPAPLPLANLQPGTLDPVWSQIRGVMAINGLPPGYGLGCWPSGHVETLLLVGDRPSLKWPASRPAWPFISALRSGCSWWLAEQLERAGMPENRLYWVDAQDRDGTVLKLPAAQHQHLFAGVVAMGRHAAAWCWDNGWVFDQVHHPQYWHRFQKDKPYQLTKLLYRKGDKREKKAGESSVGGLLALS